MNPVDMENLHDPDVYLFLLSWLASCVMVFGGVIPYIPQYLEIKRTANAEGFSTRVCLVLLIANILRIFFWFGKFFELTLLIQSFVMIMTMLALLHLCCITQAANKVSTKKHYLTDFELQYFWSWSRFEDYMLCCLCFTVLCTFITYISIESSFFIESVGLIAVLTEAMLGVPQLLQNFHYQSTEGMSVKMVMLWTAGDVFKTGYFIINETPVQFWLCGSLQIFIDVAILLQVLIYGQRMHSKYS